MQVTLRDAAFGAAALLAFPLLINLTAVTSSGEGRSVDDPLFQRGDPAPAPSPAPAAGRQEQQERPVSR